MITVYSCLLLAIANNAWSQTDSTPQQGQQYRFGFLQMIIQKSGAPALTADQQSQLESLIQNYKATWKSEGPDPAIQSAHKNYENAVLSGDAAAAKAAADALAAAIANNLPRRLEAKAAFEIQAQSILRPQIDAMRQEVGNGGIAMILGSLSGGPGMHGMHPRMMGRFGH
jgi:hypothetical protein